MAKQFSYSKKMGCGLGGYLLIWFLIGATCLFFLFQAPAFFRRAINQFPDQLLGITREVGLLHGVFWFSICFLSILTFNAHRWAAETLLWLKVCYLLFFLLVLAARFQVVGQSVFYTDYGLMLLFLVGDLALYKAMTAQNEGAFQAMDLHRSGMKGGKKAVRQDQAAGLGGGAVAVDPEVAQMNQLDGVPAGAQQRPETAAGNSLYNSARIAAMGGKMNEAFRLLEQAVASGFCDVNALETDSVIGQLKVTNPKMFEKLLARARKVAR